MLRQQTKELLNRVIGVTDCEDFSGRTLSTIFNCHRLTQPKPTCILYKRRADIQDRRELSSAQQKSPPKQKKLGRATRQFNPVRAFADN